MKFRKKPVVIEAIQWNGKNKDEVESFCYPNGIFRGEVVIQTLEGIMKGSIGDWIIKGLRGEFYPCKPDIFEASYEKVL